MKPFLLAVILLASVTSRACPQVGQPAAPLRPVAESRARAALALAFTASPGFTAKRADVCRCGKQCPCCPGCWNRDAPSESCDCQSCRCCADCKGHKSVTHGFTVKQAEPEPLSPAPDLNEGYDFSTDAGCPIATYRATGWRWRWSAEQDDWLPANQPIAVRVVVPIYQPPPVYQPTPRFFGRRGGAG